MCVVEGPRGCGAAIGLQAVEEQCVGVQWCDAPPTASYAEPVNAAPESAAAAVAICLCCCCVQDGVLQLSTALLAGLSAWSTRTAASPEERQLAAQLAADFGRHGPAPVLSQAGVARAGRADAEDVSCSEETELRVVTDRTVVSTGAGIVGSSYTQPPGLPSASHMRVPQSLFVGLSERTACCQAATCAEAVLQISPHMLCVHSIRRPAHCNNNR